MENEFSKVANPYGLSASIVICRSSLWGAIRISKTNIP